MNHDHLLKKAEKYIDRSKPCAALRLLSRPVLCNEPALPSLLNRIWGQLSDRRLSARFCKTAAALFPSESDPVTALARLCLPHCTHRDTITRLSRMMPQHFSSMSAGFHRSGSELAAAGNHKSAADLYRTAVWMDEAMQMRTSPSRCCWAASLYANRQYAEAAEAFAPCSAEDARLPLPECYSGLAQILAAEVLIAQSNCEPALEILQRLSALSEDFPGFPSVARALEGCDRHREAAAQWRIGTTSEHLSDRVFFLTRTGTALRNAGCHDEARACFAEIRHLAADDCRAVSNAWLNESLCAYAQNRPGEEIDCCLNALNIRDPRDTAHRIRPLRYCADAEYRMHHFDLGAKHYRQALDCARLLQDTRLAAKIETEWADNLREHEKDYDAATHHYSAAVALYRSILPQDGDVREPLAMALNGRGICAFHLRNYTGQIADGTVSIDILSRLQETPEILLQLSACLRNRADSLDRLNRHAAALDSYHRAADVYRKACATAPHLLDSEELPELLLCCGRMCDRMDCFDDSVDYYGQVLKLMDTRPTPLNGLDLEYTALAALRRGYAEMRCTRRNFSLGLQDFYRAITLSQDSGHANLLRICASAWRQCNELYLAMEQFNLARQAAQEAAACDAQLHLLKERKV